MGRLDVIKNLCSKAAEMHFGFCTFLVIELVLDGVRETLEPERLDTRREK